MNENTRLALDIVKSAITGRRQNLPVGFDVQNVLDIFGKHRIKTMLYYGLVINGVRIDDEIKKELSMVVWSEVSLDLNQKAELSKLCAEFDEKGIDYMLLKGAMLKNLYPKSEIRRMGDIDILIKEENYAQIEKIMKNLGYEFTGETDHEYKWDTGIVSIELHRKLFQSNIADLYDYYGDGWKRAVKGDDSYSLSNEDNFIYIFSHFTKHFRGSGIGVIHMCDLWVYIKERNLDGDYIRAQLTKMNLYDFYLNVMSTLRVWFDDEESTPVTDYITEFILESGIYGTHINHILSLALRASKENKNGKIRRVVRGIFPPYSAMKNRHVVLVKHAWLLPIFWAVRWFDVVFNKRENIAKHKEDFAISADDNVADFKKHLEFVGLNSEY